MRLFKTFKSDQNCSQVEFLKKDPHAYARKSFKLTRHLSTLSVLTLLEHFCIFLGEVSWIENIIRLQTKHLAKQYAFQRKVAVFEEKQYW